MSTTPEREKSLDERIPEATSSDHLPEVPAGAAAAFIPQTGQGVESPLDEERRDMGPGETVLEQERKAVRQQPKPGG